MTWSRREYDAARYRARRDEWLAGKVCAECGSSDNLELDHIDPSTKDPSLKVSHNMWRWSDSKREVEIAKCQALCRACHLAKSAAERTVHHEHGTTGMYQRGCKCDDCRAANAAYERGRRAAKRALPPTT